MSVYFRPQQAQRIWDTVFLVDSRHTFSRIPSQSRVLLVLVISFSPGWNFFATILAACLGYHILDLFRSNHLEDSPSQAHVLLVLVLVLVFSFNGTCTGIGC